MITRRRRLARLAADHLGIEATQVRVSADDFGVHCAQAGRVIACTYPSRTVVQVSEDDGPSGVSVSGIAEEDSRSYDSIRECLRRADIGYAAAERLAEQLTQAGLDVDDITARVSGELVAITVHTMGGPIAVTPDGDQWSLAGVRLSGESLADLIRGADAAEEIALT